MFETLEDRRLMSATYQVEAAPAPDTAPAATNSQPTSEGMVFTSVSNVLKLRHDTAKNSIGN